VISFISNHILGDVVCIFRDIGLVSAMILCWSALEFGVTFGVESSYSFLLQHMMLLLADNVWVSDISCCHMSLSLEGASRRRFRLTRLTSTMSCCESEKMPCGSLKYSIRLFLDLFNVNESKWKKFEDKFSRFDTICIRDTQPPHNSIGHTV